MKKVTLIDATPLYTGTAPKLAKEVLGPQSLRRRLLAQTIRSALPSSFCQDPMISSGLDDNKDTATILH